jgi:hypothetical protein
MSRNKGGQFVQHAVGRFCNAVIVQSSAARLEDESRAIEDGSDHGKEA